MAISSTPLSTFTACASPLDLPSGQVGLRQIARYDHPAPLAQTGEKHLHLFARGVLRFVQDDEGARERSAAHVGEGARLR